jgi:hypothetical protein
LSEWRVNGWMDQGGEKDGEMEMETEIEIEIEMRD